MKKVFLMLAAVAALTACSASSNDDGNANANDSTAVEEQTANVDAEKIGPCSMESSDMTLDVPEGWKAEVGGFDEIIMKKDREDGMTQKIEVSVIKGKTVAERISDLIGTNIGTDDNSNFVKGADVKMGEFNCSTVRCESSELYHSIAAKDDRILDVTTNFIKPEAPEVIAAVESVKLK